MKALPIRVAAAARVLGAAVILVSAGAAPAYADLFISPLRIVFQDRDRTAEVLLVNQSDTTKTYRVGWQEKIALPDGGYEDIDEPGQDFIGASALVRYSPRQVTLGPREQQQIRLSLNREGELPSGEYRSHLTFTEIPSEEPRVGAAPAEGVGIELVLSLSFSIPVMVRSGGEGTVVSVAGARFVYDQGQRLNVEVDIAREGPFSAFGDLSVFWRADANSPERKIGALNNVAVYSEVDVRQARIILSEATLSTGILRIVYVGRGEYAGRVWFERSMRIGG